MYSCPYAEIAYVFLLVVPAGVVLLDCILYAYIPRGRKRLSAVSIPMRR